MRKQSSTLDHNTLKQMKTLSLKMKAQEFKREKIDWNEFRTIKDYCELLGYKLSINNQWKTMKVFNPITKRWGYMQKMNNTIFYGYIKKIEGNSHFIKKYSIEDNINIFAILKKFVSKEAHKQLLSKTCGILELEYANV